MFRILTDTSANLPTDLLFRHDVEAVPFSYIVDGTEHTCTDTSRFDDAAFYRAIQNGLVVTTSQINPHLYVEYMEEILKDGDDVLYIGMSSGISGSYDRAEMAAAKLRELYPERRIITVDTLGASLGEGIPVLWAIKWRRQGKSITETARLVRELCTRMYQVFTVDDLMHLRRTGRCSNISAAIGTVLNIKPLLKGNENGQIVTFDKVRGRRRALKAMADCYARLVKDPQKQIVGIAHADCLDDALYLIRLLEEKNPPGRILTVPYEPVTGSHVGPGTLALFFESEEGARML